MSIPEPLEKLFDRELRERLVALRRDLHRHPELSWQEKRTAERLHAALTELEPARLERVAGTGLCARIPGDDPSAPVVAIRGDIDALPIQEATGLDFSSENAGVMHACGHDVHATWTIGAGWLLRSRPAPGDVLLVLQPAEELGTGAPAILESGALDGVQAIFGAHVDRRFPVGRVVAQAGPLAAAADSFRVELVGSGGHGARPHETTDPIVGLGALIGALHAIVSRRLEPGTPGVLSIGHVEGGTAPNVIPESAWLEGTIRALDAGTRELLHSELRRIAEHTAAAFRLHPEVRIDLGPPPIVNEPGPIEWARSAVRSVLGEDGLARMDTLNMGGEDFAHYLERLRGAFLRVGACEPGGAPIPAHTPRFYAAEESIFVGAAVLAETARQASAGLSEG